MERDSFNENLEQFLRESANNLRMRASDRVWTQLSRELLKRRRRINYSLAAFLVLTFGLGYYFISDGGKPLPTADLTPLPKTEIREAPKALPVNPSTPEITAVLSPRQSNRKVQTENLPLETIAKAEPFTTVENNIASENASVDFSEEITTVAQTSVLQAGEPAAEKSDDASEIISATQPSKTDVGQTAFVNSATETAFSAKSRKLSWQLSLTPTISYRKLGENKSYLRSTPSFAAPANVAALYNVNNAVTHKPDLGFELGVQAKYKLAKSLKATGGLQFNVNRYDIKAFDAPYAMATIQLNTSSGISAVRAVTPYSNTAGYNSNWLQNFYFQMSAPLGLEFSVAGNDKMQFGFAGTVQPSYLLGDRAYLITSDYKNYAEVPWLVRRWNANTSLQTFVNYSTGKLKWQIGPQVRYQLLSSFISKYPVKENLFDFGMKVGVNLNKD